MHDDTIRFSQRQLFLIKTVQAVEFTLTGQQRTFHALLLQAQHDHHIQIFHTPGHVVFHSTTEIFHVSWQQRARCNDSHLCSTQLIERAYLRTGHAGVQNVADNGHLQPGKPALVLANGQHIEHRLGRVCMPAVSGIDNRYPRRHALGDEVWRTTLGVTDHEHVTGHRLQIQQRVRQGFTLGGGRSGNVQVEHVRRQPFAGQFEGASGAGTGLKKQIDDRATSQQRDLLDAALAHFDERVGRVQNVCEQFAVQAVQGKKMPQLTIPGQLQVVRGRVVRGHGSPVVCWVVLLPGFLKLDMQRFGAAQFYSLMGFQFNYLANHIRLDWQFPGAQVDQCGQYDTGRTSIIEDLVHRRPNCAAAHDDIVDENNIAAFRVERQARGPDLRIEADSAEIIPIEGNIKLAKRLSKAQTLTHDICQPDATGTYPDQRRIVDTTLVQNPAQSGFQLIKQLVDI